MFNQIILKLVVGIFRIVHLFFPKRREKFEPTGIKKILLINTTALGDTLMSTPAIKAVRKAYPLAYIASLVDRRRVELLKGNPHLDELILYPGKFKKVPSLLKTLRQKRFDLAIILHANDPDIVPLAYLSRARYRVGWAESKLSFLLTHSVPRRKGLSFIDHKLEILKEIGIGSQGREAEFFLYPEEEKWAQDFLLSQKIREDSILIGIHPFGSNKNKWWSFPKVKEFCDLLKKEQGLKLLIFGGNKEAVWAKRIAYLGKTKPLVIAGKVSLRQAAALIKHCQLFISTDSGPMHLSLALKIPTLALFGPGNPELTGPLSSPHRIIQKKLPCTPCSSKTCDKDKHCMELITAQEVWEVAKEMLGKTSLKEEVSLFRASPGKGENYGVTS